MKTQMQTIQTIQKKILKTIQKKILKKTCFLTLHKYIYFSALSGCVPLPLLAIYEHTVIGMRCLFTFFLSHNRGGSASSAALLTAALLLTEIYVGFIQVQRPHLPHGHALRQGALGEALPRPLLAHLVAPTALFSQHVWHMFGVCLCAMR
jgi:hypothetical protein